jgi:4-diphosphocytidyl-2-C-methyl-D-erythritol kinase
MTITERAAAKVNLTLHVHGRRPDGYHQLESLVAFARDVRDEVSLDTTKAVSLEVAGPFAAAIEGENLIAGAWRLLDGLTPRLQLGKVALTKMLPVASGLGGGSADVAALLRCVRRANPQADRRIDWAAAARSLGADVSVCLESQTALVGGIGDRVQPVTGLPPLAALLVNPGLPLATRSVFEALGAGPAPTTQPASETLPAAELLMSYLERGRNDLERPAARLLPAIDAVLDALRKSPGCLLARMSGSGPTCFGIYPGAAAASTAARIIGEAAPNWWVRTTRLG